MYQSTMNGIEKISSTELFHYLTLIKLELSVWEAKAVLEMSFNFCLWYGKAKDKNCESPYDHEDYHLEVMLNERRPIILAAFKARSEAIRIAQSKTS